MYDDFLNTVAGRQFANNIGRIADALQKERRQELYHCSSSEEVEDVLECMLRKGYRFVSLHRNAKGDLLLILEHDV